MMAAEYTVKLAQHEVRDFVRAAENCDCDVDILTDRYVIDAKSILGVLSVDLTRPIRVRTSEEDPAFAYSIQKYILHSATA